MGNISIFKDNVTDCVPNFLVFKKNKIISDMARWGSTVWSKQERKNKIFKFKTTEAQKKRQETLSVQIPHRTRRSMSENTSSIWLIRYCKHL